MVRQIVIEAETPGDSRTMFRLRIDASAIAEGLTAVCAALRAGDVDTLIVGELGDATLVTGEELTTVAPNADALSELGEAPVRVVRADEALPFVAITIRASVVRVDDRIAPADGIGALLRYAPTGVLGDSGAPSRSIAL